MRKFIVISNISVQVEVYADDTDQAEDIAGRKISDILELHDCDYEFDRNPIVEEVHNEHA